MRYIFNPEHDLCLANGSPTFVPPESALKFGHDCSDILENVLGQSGCRDDVTVPWGWNSVLKYSLLKAGTPEVLLPSDEALAQIRKLSHRRMAIMAGKYIRERLKESGQAGSVSADSGLTDFLIQDTPEEIDSPDLVDGFLEKHPNAVFKAPWSGSGKGLRWIRRSEFSHSDRGWCRNIIAKQGSVIAESREDVVCNFAMLFQSTATGIIFEGYSLFDTDNGAYRSNILASDRYILTYLSRLVPEQVLTAVRRQLTAFLEENFLGRYEGYLGVDMFICKANTETDHIHGTVPVTARNIIQPTDSITDPMKHRTTDIADPTYRTSSIADPTYLTSGIAASKTYRTSNSAGPTYRASNIAGRTTDIVDPMTQQLEVPTDFLPKGSSDLKGRTDLTKSGHNLIVTTESHNAEAVNNDNNVGQSTLTMDSQGKNPIMTMDNHGKYLLNPCVEINVRMTMGLLARKYFDLHMQHGAIPECPSVYNAAECCKEETVSGNEKASIDGRYRFSVIYAPDSATLRKQLAPAVHILTSISESTRYAIAVF